MYSFFKNAREPMSSYTHFLGVIFAAVGTVFLVILNNVTGDFSVRMLVSILAFGGSMLALYSASSLYHYYNGPVFKQEYLRKLDHAMIYVLIAGSYTPICLKFMEGTHGILFVCGVWAVALCGFVAIAVFGLHPILVVVCAAAYGLFVRGRVVKAVDARKNRKGGDEA